MWITAENQRALHPPRAALASSVTNARKHLREIQMTKFVTFAAAFVLFAPVAAVTLMQAAQIIA